MGTCKRHKGLHHSLPVAILCGLVRFQIDWATCRGHKVAPGIELYLCMLSEKENCWVLSLVL